MEPPEIMRGSLTDQLKREARRLGFDLAGATAAVRPPGIHRFRRWLENGFAGDMHYMAERVESYEHPRHVLEGAKSIVVLATNYRSEEPMPPGPGQGAVSRYAWGGDYHDVIFSRLKRLPIFTANSRPRPRFAVSWTLLHCLNES